MLHAAAAGSGDGTDAVADGGVGATRLLRVKNRTMVIVDLAPVKVVLVKRMKKKKTHTHTHQGRCLSSPPFPSYYPTIAAAPRLCS